jgi:transposase
MARKRPHAYPPDFRQKVVELARAGRRLDDLASEFGLGRQTVRNWVKQVDLDAGSRSDGLTSAEHEEVARLRKRVRQLEVEREILSKAAAWFARETDSIPPKSSNS